MKNRYEILNEVIQNKHYHNIYTISEIDYKKELRLSIINSDTKEIIKEVRYKNNKKLEDWMNKNHIFIPATNSKK